MAKRPAATKRKTLHKTSGAVSPKRNAKNIITPAHAPEAAPPDKRPVGRPPVFTPEVTAREGLALLAWLEEDKGRFWLGQFASQRGYSRVRWAEWVRDPKHQEFADFYQRAREIQEYRIFSMGLALRNQSLVCLALKTHHSWVEPIEHRGQVNVNHSGTVASKLPDLEIHRLIMTGISERQRELEAAPGKRGKKQ